MELKTDNWSDKILRTAIDKLVEQISNAIAEKVCTSLHNFFKYNKSTEPSSHHFVGGRKLSVRFVSKASHRCHNHPKGGGGFSHPFPHPTSPLKIGGRDRGRSSGHRQHLVFPPKGRLGGHKHRWEPEGRTGRRGSCWDPIYKRQGVAHRIYDGGGVF